MRPAAAENVINNSQMKQRLLQKLTDHRIVLAGIIFGCAIIYSQFDVFNQPIRGDRANWEYMAQLISRGGVPYRDAVNIKTPLSAYIGALAIEIGQLFGARDIYSVRISSVVTGLLCVVFTYLVTLAWFSSIRSAVLAAAMLASVNSFAVANSAGIQPKTPVILFGLISLWAVKKGWPFASGFAGMLAALCWQPGLLFVGAAGLAFSRYLIEWKNRNVLRLIIGAVVPLLFTILYFWLNGALRDFYNWTFDFNLHVYGPREYKSSIHFLRYLRSMLSGEYRPERFYCLLAAAGAIWFVLEQVRGIRRAGIKQAIKENSLDHAILIAPLVYFAFCFVDVQGAADFFPFLPFIAIFFGYVVVQSIEKAQEFLSQRLPLLNGRWFPAFSLALVLVVIFVFSLRDSFSYRRPRSPLAQQQQEVTTILSHLDPEDQIFAHGPTEVLVLSGINNASKYFFLDRGKDLYLDRVEPGGFDGWFSRLKSSRPKVVLLSRTAKVEKADEFYDWVGTEYTEQKLAELTYYLRKD